ncbi:MAG: DUF2442 domain-containing protein [Acidobacteria bacterium]|nr:DUF2442 domain-containing protein [Acidobacteriota bacterium]
MEQREFVRAGKRAQLLQSSTPRAVRARYDARTRRIVVDLSSHVSIMFSPADIEGLENATRSALANVEITPSGFGLSFPGLDADIYLPALLQGYTGSRRWMATHLGQLGGKSTSPAKKRASRANGALGGRPRRRSRQR